MIRAKSLIYIFVLVGLFFLQSCKENLVQVFSNQKQKIQIHYTSRDSTEAKEFALWLSGKLQPPDSLVSELLYSLGYLRYCFGDSIRYQDSIYVLRSERFMTPWLVSFITVVFDDTTIQKINSGKYDSWNQLPKYLQPKFPLDITYGWAEIGFEGYFHPRRIAELYKALPGVLGASPGSWMFLSGGYPICPRLVGDEITYLFTWYDIQSYFGTFKCWYFKYINGEPKFIGEWQSKNIPNEESPAWWAEAKYNAWNFAKWDGY